jgi:ketosteroid isomerase-like protein
MKTRTRLIWSIATLLLFSTAMAEDIRDDEADVLLTIERQWEAARKSDQDKVDGMLADNFMGWSRSSPAPRSKKSTSKWSRIADKEVGKVLRYELYPLSITVHGDVAVAHYLYSTVFKAKDGTVKMNNGRYTDVLIRGEDGWKFVAWHGGNDD